MDLGKNLCFLITVVVDVSVFLSFVRYHFIEMPTESSYPKIAIPEVDIWTFLFEGKDRKYPDDKGMV